MRPSERRLSLRLLSFYFYEGGTAMADQKREKAESKKSTEQLKAERQSDATDDEVLREEENRSSSGAGNKGKDSSPSPDGAFDEREEREKAGPI